MAKQLFKASPILYPVPVLMVSSGKFNGEKNIMTLSWTGTLNTSPAMTYVSVRPERHSYKLIKDTGEFVLNLITKSLVKKTDMCGLKSGKDIDKFEYLNLTAEKGLTLDCPVIKESPLNIECKVKDIIPLGTHHMFIGEIVGVMVEESYINKNKTIDLNKEPLICYSNREYYALGEFIGKYGYSKK